MKTYSSILKIKSLKVDYSIPVITTPYGYELMREASHIVKDGDKLIWLTTCVKDNVYSLHRFECSINDDKNWTNKGKLSLKGQGGVELEGEDPTFTIAPTGEIHLLCENKSYEKSHGMFVISKFIATDWDSPFMFQGGSTGVSPFGNGFAKDAVYSPFYTNTHLDPIIFDGRKGKWEENIFYATWNGTKYVPDPDPIFTVNDISLPIKTLPNSKVLTTGIGDAVFKVNDKYLMEIVAYKDWDYDKWLSGTGGYNGYWCQGLAISDSLRSGWKELNSEIKDQNGKNLQFNLFYSNGWKALISEPTKIYLAEIVTDDHDLSEHINNDPSLPHHSPTVSDNVLLMREIRPILVRLEEEAKINSVGLVTEQEAHYMIDIIDEIS